MMYSNLLFMPLKEPAAPERINYLEEPYLEAPEGAVELSRGDTHLCPSPRSAKYVVQLLDDEGAIIEVIELSMWEEDMLGFTEASAGTGPGGHGRKVRAAKCRRGRGGMQ